MRRRRSYSRYGSAGSHAPATQAELDAASSNQIIIARVEWLDHDSRLFKLLGTEWPRRGDVVVFHLSVKRSKPTATIFVVPLDAPPSMRNTDIQVSTGTIPAEGVPIVQFRSLTFYRVVDQVREFLVGSDPGDDKDVLHYLGLFETYVKEAMRRRTLSITPALEARWRRYGSVRTLYLQPGTDGEKQGARMAVLRIVRAFLKDMTPNGNTQGG